MGGKVQKIIDKVYGEVNVTTDDDGIITSISSPFKSFVGYSVDDLITFYEQCGENLCREDIRGAGKTNVSGQDKIGKEVFSLRFKESFGL